MRLGRTSFGRRPERRTLPASLRRKRASLSWGSPPRQKQADGACDAGGHQVHETDHEYAEDRPGGGLRDLVGDVRDELDEQGAVESPADRGEAAHHDADEKDDRKEHAEAVGGDELHGERPKGARDAGEHGRNAECKRLVERVVDAHRLDAMCWSRIATRARPMRPRSRFQPSTNMSTVTPRVKKYSHRSASSGIPNGASGFAMTMPCTPPVHFSR